MSWTTTLSILFLLDSSRTRHAFYHRNTWRSEESVRASRLTSKPDRGSTLRYFSAEEVRLHLDWSHIVEQLRVGFADSSAYTVPQRHHHALLDDSGERATLLLMPAWRLQSYIGVKVASVFPDNRLKNLPSVHGVYLLMDGDNGTPLAVFDGAEITARRTAAASVLAATYLARPDASTLLLVGAGVVSENLAHAYSSQFSISRILVWNHRQKGALQLAEKLRKSNLPAESVENLEGAVGAADIITCATLSKEPLVLGDWLQPGVHLDLVGGYTPAMRETDDMAVQRASIFVDSFEAGLVEPGDIVSPLESGVISIEDIKGDLFTLTQNKIVGRSSDKEITLFKSVGHGLEDILAASAVYEAAMP